MYRPYGAQLDRLEIRRPHPIYLDWIVSIFVPPKHRDRYVTYLS